MPLDVLIKDSAMAPPWTLLEKQLLKINKSNKSNLKNCYTLGLEGDKWEPPNNPLKFRINSWVESYEKETGTSV